jgi:hypothetical protein
VAKPPTCLRTQVTSWTPPLADQCSLTHTRAKASPFCGQTSCELKSSPPTFSSSLGKPRFDRDLLFARRRPRRVVHCLCRPSPRRAALFRHRRSAHARARTRGSRALLSLSNRCTRMFTRTHALASELPRRHGHPSRDAAELEPYRAVYHRVAVLVWELHLTAARSCMRSTKLSPLLSVLESGEHVRACEPNLTAAQPIAAGTPSSRASFPPRRASAGPTRVRVRSQARERIQP